MAESAETGDVPERPAVDSELCAELRRTMRAKGVSQKQLVARLADRGIQISPPTMTRILKGKRPLSEGELKIICELIGEESRFDELRALWRGEKRTPGKPEEPKQAGRGAAGLDFIKRHAIALLVVSVLVLSAGVLTALFVFNGGTAEPPSPLGKPTGAPAGTCDRYAVAPRDLWLRDERGGTVVELPHGLQMTVKSRGSKYWEVTTEDGRDGWVDHGHLTPVC